MMEGNFSSRNMMQSNCSYLDFNLHGPMRVHHGQQGAIKHPEQRPHPGQGTSVHHSVHVNFPLSIGRLQDCDQTVSQAGYSKGERGKSASDEDEQICMADNGPSKGKKTSSWQRVKWTDTMVRLLITSVSYISEEAALEYGGGARRKCVNLQKKGKWKTVSKVMAQRGYFVSPQQCEDKFNDLNKRYKRLNEILGRGTSCEVVENPALLDMMDHISAEGKEEVRKILSSKHLHYEEMCSYHNGNRLHLPPDPELQHSLRLALRNGDDNNDDTVKRQMQDDELGEEIELDENDESDEYHILFGDPRAYKISGSAPKRIKQCQTNEELGCRNSSISLDSNRTSNFQQKNAGADINQVPPEGMKENMLQKQWTNHSALRLEDKRLNIQAQMLELEKERIKWQRFCQKKDRGLEMMRLEIEKMKLENERMALELRQKEIGFDIS